MLSKKIISFVSIAFASLFAIFALTSCSQKADPVDALKLEVSYEGKQFMSDGIGEASLAYATDGDTATFSADRQVTIRFFAIDTPESTVDVDKWGKTASLYVADILENATAIVLEATTTPPSVDSYGSRYLAYVWYKSADDAEFRNLNLQIVREGFSQYASNSSECKYDSYFKEAENLARSEGKHIWGNDEDPNFSDDPIDTDLKYINENQADLVNQMVRFNAYIKGITGSYIYVEDIIDGQVYKYTLFNRNISASFLSQGNYISFLGTLQLYNDSYQISGIKYTPLSTEETHCLTYGYYLAFGLGARVTGYNYGAITISDVTTNNNVLTITGTSYSNKLDELGVTLTYKLKGNEDLTKLSEGVMISAFGINEDGTNANATQVSCEVFDFTNIVIIE